MQSNLLTIKEVQEMLSLSQASIYLKMNPKYTAYFDETFPKPVKLGGRSNRWRKSDLEIWINKKDPNFKSLKLKEIVNE
ncbi:helix-turn-helix transcriptional regulator [Taylorella equigenitalis]|uniref:AlpA family phage regulatory protein n=1 Tax=Taylorella equigenitalis (strain MCE9) TaxID=937774 RepID=A0A654KJ88_TAYEM|nr:AlpA family phage regulatory protein [Taylorella equigenitalis]ADU92429.1 hypothetical protein TEQUI_1517 [Taylorella equigenitalis MCE9]ASY39393.1 hypothetical protein CA604_04555 [Taylorella equigenitalis]WDU48756.1 AlpA family phage regulatory protein [Taylorella equigenitalis]WDU51231.1 AlpA family phage regulatory protein [Taylorella equigenitalis]WDU55720.1 AlpA family phage regulatory protein [Taylorella equigenitalis]